MVCQEYKKRAILVALMEVTRHRYLDVFQDRMAESSFVGLSFFVIRIWNMCTDTFEPIMYVPIRLPVGISIAGDMVATVLWSQDPKVFVIISEENAQNYRAFFYDIWKDADDPGGI